MQCQNLWGLLCECKDLWGPLCGPKPPAPQSKGEGTKAFRRRKDANVLVHFVIVFYFYFGFGLGALVTAAFAHSGERGPQYLLFGDWSAQIASVGVVNVGERFHADIPKAIFRAQGPVVPRAIVIYLVHFKPQGPGGRLAVNHFAPFDKKQATTSE